MAPMPSRAADNPPADTLESSHARLVAVVRAVRLDSVMEALLALGPTQVSIEQVRGYGRQKEHLEFYEEVGAWDGTFLPKVRLEFAVPASEAGAAVKALRAAAHTGRTGDGKIFVHAVEVAAVGVVGERPSGSLPPESA
jgi:nitrogen regulatory protein PII